VDRLLEVTWFAGLFEGEGSFRFHKEIPKAVVIQMTDLDVLEHVQQVFGGSIFKVTKRQSHWKDAWVWTLTGSAAADLIREMLPYLHARRSDRARQYLERHRSAEQYSQERSDSKALLVSKVYSLRDSGLTHQQIADELKYDRTYVTKILGERSRKARR
jgi:hypothetical protein